MAEAPSPRQRADGFIERSKSLSEIGRWKDAELQARRAVEADPTHVRARLQLAHVLMTLGHGSEAADLVKGVLAQEPSSDWAIRILANWYGAQGRHKEAVELAEQAVRLSNGDRIALLYLSYAKRDAGDLVGSRITAERIVAEFPDWPDGFVRLAETRHSPEEAVLAYREALRLDPHCDDALAGLAGLSGALAQYREAVSMAWSSLRSDVTDTTRQRFFARSAWIYLALTRIVAPLRSTHRALAEPFGEACALAFRATGSNVAERLLFAFRFELGGLTTWSVLVVGMVGVSYLPDALSTILVPLLGIPVLLGPAIFLFVVFSVIAAARRLLDLRITQWSGRGSLKSVLARAVVSGAVLFGLAVALLLLWPAKAGLWAWLLVFSIPLMIQDATRWRDQWRDSRRTAEAGSARQAFFTLLSERAQRWFTSARLAVFLVVAMAVEVAMRGIERSLDHTDPPLTAVAALGALLCFVVDLGARRFAARCEPGPRADRWRALGRSLMELAWMLSAVTALVAIGGRLLEGDAVEALFPILLVPLIVGGGWLVWRATLALMAVIGAETLRLVRKLRHPGSASAPPEDASAID